MSTQIHSGACFCRAITYTVTGKPILSAYCHCTRCQILNGSAFIWTIHFHSSAFAWTHPEPHDTALETYVTEGKPWKTRFRCKKCGSCVGSYNKQTENWSVWGAQLDRDEAGATKNWDGIKPTAHIFYGTAMVQCADELGKWEGYEDKSKRIA